VDEGLEDAVDVRADGRTVGGAIVGSVKRGGAQKGGSE